VDPHGKPAIASDAPAVALVDGHNAQGPVVGKFCMDLAIEKAKSVGCAWVVCKNSNHYGIAVRPHARIQTAQALLMHWFTDTHTHTHTHTHTRCCNATMPRLRLRHM
jgi:LDH2 family malate/lactate/ureidoglycolate dehydrogenase